jgi:hypothetical protein
MSTDIDHIRRIGRIRVEQKRLSIGALLLLAGCSGPALVENSTTAVTVRYGSTDGIEEATQLAQKACSVHHKTARLRNIANFGLSERYGHFDCI